MQDLIHSYLDADSMEVEGTGSRDGWTQGNVLLFALAQFLGGNLQEELTLPAFRV